jgi:hypothetical protein
MPVILVTQEAEIRRIATRNSTSKLFARPYLENAQQEKGLKEWLRL